MPKRNALKIDYLLLATFLILLGIGLTVLASASSDLGKIDFNDPYHFLRDQIIIGLGIGGIGFLLGLFIDYKVYKKLAPIILFGSVGLLLITFTPLGTTLGGAQRWITIGSFTIQPSELLKMTMIIYLAAWLSNSHINRIKSFSEGLIPFLSIVGFVSLLLLFQKSTSAAVVIGVSSLFLYFVAGAKWKFVFMVIALGVFLLTIFVVITPYRLDRVKTFLDPSQDTQGSSYQANQALTIVGSGGFFGVGFGQSSAKAHLPERIGDSIFAIIAEEFGYLGVTVVGTLFFTMVGRAFFISKKIKDRFGRLLIIGLATVIGFQAFVHMGAASALLPTTGVPLPFISFGSFSLAVFMTMVGIMLSVQRNG
ncbi:MAG: hypothetical protein COT88_01655 [Candidatus Colwellbacteria bacterium CG10_big_fil_rev_8_21_14_0_10_41_28]|uniref:Probable peptidoglycan glycosyltransferase FtsW n=1 Tax=Candidatus Colwellbacteria bacterium CG10_big_fil_rev_8_21_14_0_10_41_28 TaxID=1974539 RepID=A0A2H0VHF0_9BACT|nr:MAG: hypothetical protein COT88_01655 [Candidatus Colwellbacteria bacterium CG10_big_fil_rev_8_21_14_0_10_41_28]